MTKYGIDVPSLAVGFFVGASVIMLGATDPWNESVWAFLGGASGSLIPAAVAVFFPLWLRRQDQSEARKSAAELAGPFVARAVAAIDRGSQYNPREVVPLSSGESQAGHVAAVNAARSALRELDQVRSADVACISGATNFLAWLKADLKNAIEHYEADTTPNQERVTSIIESLGNLRFRADNLLKLLGDHGAPKCSPL